MTRGDQAGETAATATEHGETARQIRGSGVLAAGRLISMLATMIALVIVARYLEKDEYGAFVYALSIATAFETLIALGLDRAVPRFLPQYDERGQTARFIGTLVLVLGSIVVLGLLSILVVFGLRDLAGDEIAGSDLTPVLLSILIVLAPIQAIDNVLTGVFAVFADARVIFLRRFVLAPGLRLLVVLLLVGGSFGPVFLAVGYVVAGLIGVALYVGLAWRLLRRHLPGDLRGRRVEVPLHEILAYTIPLLTTDVVYLSMTTIDTLVLGHSGGVSAVADLRVVDPVARANTLVQASFATLFVPRAARLFARGDREGQRELYWRSATWMAILAFPIFAASFTLAEPVVVLLFGERYAASAVVLAMLALGRYVDTAFGNNGLALRVFGSSRQVVAVNLTAAAANVTLVLLLTPRFGAPGAAAATMLTLFMYNGLKQAALQRATGFALPNRSELWVYASIAVATIVLLVVGSALPEGRVLQIPLALIVGLPLVAVVSVVLVRFNRDRLDLGTTFPELLRLPLVPLVLGRPSK